MLTLAQKQQAFPGLVAKLIFEVYAMGYTAAFGEAWRSPEQVQWDYQHGSGNQHSLHPERLAVDLLLYRDGVWLRESAEYAAAGEFWKRLSTPLLTLCWGGDFRDAAGRPKPDGNHFSCAHAGLK